MKLFAFALLIAAQSTFADIDPKQPTRFVIESDSTSLGFLAKNIGQANDVSLTCVSAKNENLVFVEKTNKSGGFSFEIPTQSEVNILTVGGCELSIQVSMGDSKRVYKRALRELLDNDGAYIPMLIYESTSTIKLTLSNLYLNDYQIYSSYLGQAPQFNTEDISVLKYLFKALLTGESFAIP